METSRQREALARAKAHPWSHRIPVADASGRLVGRLEPVGAAAVEDLALVRDLCRWRAAAMTSFLTVFTPSEQATRSYLRNLAVRGADRILFIIQGVDGARLGNIGLCNVTEHDVELDNVLRGEAAPVHGFMHHVQRTIAVWIQDHLGCSNLFLNVLSDNHRAVTAYRRAGFEVVGETPLKREDFSGGYRLIICDEDDPLKCERMSKMQVSIRRLGRGLVS